MATSYKIKLVSHGNLSCLDYVRFYAVVNYVVRLRNGNNTRNLWHYQLVQNILMKIF